MVYTDEDRIDPATIERWNPFFKPDWSPDLLLSMNYLGPLTFFAVSGCWRLAGCARATRRRDLRSGAARLGACRTKWSTFRMSWSRPSSARPQPASRGMRRIGGRPSAGRSSTRCTAAVVAGNVERGIHPGSWRVRYALDDLPAVTGGHPHRRQSQLLRAVPGRSAGAHQLSEPRYPARRQLERRRRRIASSPSLRRAIRTCAASSTRANRSTTRRWSTRRFPTSPRPSS